MYTETDILYSDEERILFVKELISDWEYIKAKRMLEEILENDSMQEEAYYLLGHLYDRCYSDPKKALPYYYNAVQINSEFFEASHALVRLLNECNEPKTALKYAEKGSRCNSRYQEWIVFESAVAHEKLLELEHAQHLYNNLLATSTEETLIERVESSLERVKMKIERRNELGLKGAKWFYTNIA